MQKILTLNKLFQKYMEINKQIIDDYGIATVPAKKLENYQ